MTTREAQAGLQLARGIVRGLWTLEQLDRPSEAAQTVEDDRLASAHPDTRRAPWEPHDGPAMPYPGAGTTRHAGNLAREWIAAFPDQWDALQAGDDPDAAGGLGTAASREKARLMVLAFDRLVDSGYDFNANLQRRQITFPEVIHGPVGYRPPWHPAWKGAGNELSPVGRAEQDQQEASHAA